jgi:hypothetical protein
MQFLRGRDYVTLLADIGDPAKGGNGTVMRGGFAVASLRPVTGVGDLLNDGLCGWFEVQKRAGAVNENLVDITVRVQWQGGQGGPQVYELVSMKSDRGQRWNPNP